MKKNVKTGNLTIRSVASAIGVDGGRRKSVPAQINAKFLTVILLRSQLIATRSKWAQIKARRRAFTLKIKRNYESLF